MGRRTAAPALVPMASVSVISGDSLVDAMKKLRRCFNEYRCFSNLWRFSGGATTPYVMEIPVVQRFSNLWRFSGGATTCHYAPTWRKPVSVISGDSLVGRPPLDARAIGQRSVSVISGDSLVGRQMAFLWYPTLEKMVSVISGDSLVGRRGGCAARLLVGRFQ